MSRSRNSRRGSQVFPKPGRPRFGVIWVRPQSKRQRRAARTALAAGAKPEPYRPRHGARRDYW